MKWTLEESRGEIYFNGRKSRQRTEERLGWNCVIPFQLQTYFVSWTTDATHLLKFKECIISVYINILLSSVMCSVNLIASARLTKIHYLLQCVFICSVQIYLWNLTRNLSLFVHSTIVVNVSSPVFIFLICRFGFPYQKSGRCFLWWRWKISFQQQ